MLVYGHSYGCSPRKAERRSATKPVDQELLRDPLLRASDHDRQETVRALSEHTAAGRLTLDEFEERVGAAHGAQRLGDLQPLLADLPATRPVTVERPSSGELAGAVRADWRPWAGWMLVAVICLAVWALTSIGSQRLLYFWPIWVIGPWGVSMLLRGVGTRTRAGSASR